MKWYNTKVGQLQIYVYLVAIIYTFFVNYFMYEFFSRDFTSMDWFTAIINIQYLFFIFFIPSVFITWFSSKSEKTKMIWVYIMTIVVILSVNGNWMNYLLYETSISDDEFGDMLKYLWVFTIVATVLIFSFKFFRNKILSYSNFNQYLENDSIKIVSDDKNKAILKEKSNFSKRGKSKIKDIDISKKIQFIVLSTVILFLLFFISCKTFIPSYYVNRNDRITQEDAIKANQYWMIFSNSYYPGTERQMELLKNPPKKRKFLF